MRYDSLPEITMKLYHPPSQIATGFPTPRMRSLSLSCDEDVLRPNHCASPPERASNYVSNGRAPAAGKTGLSRRCLALESFAPARFLTARSSSSSSSSRTLGSSHLIGEGGETTRSDVLRDNLGILRLDQRQCRSGGALCLPP
jgi:hypothetical protein